ncbi:glycosyl transferase [Cichlidogyrus casuarinus]|uniref:Alpha-1,3-glucosyltransferase n=1 Tax=Cichlidogyrus casuarinus TaxID=1844966 RepID=A0ABD2Q6K3_9PLAT
MCIEKNAALTFHYISFIKMATTVLSIFVLSLGPFIYLGQMPNLLGRLFPFDRGLTHAYWAPNFWALYNAADLVLQRFFSAPSVKSFSTIGLVKNVKHLVLPTIGPWLTAFCVLCSSLPFIIQCLQKSDLFVALKNRTSLKPVDSMSKQKQFLISLIGCAWASFMFGWHVHEKAILVVLLPLKLVY